jgi:peptide/nickel transport system permease protein
MKNSILSKWSSAIFFMSYNEIADGFKVLIKFLFMIFALLVFSFTLMEIKPGDPALAIAGKKASPQTLEKIRIEYGLQLNLFDRIYFSLKKYTKGNLGYTLDGKEISELIKKSFPPTITLAIFAALISFLSAVFFSILSIESNLGEKIILPVANALLSTPIFIIAILLLYVFYYYLELLPPGGYSSETIIFLILPAFSLGLKSFSRIFFFIRSKLLDEYKSNWFKAYQARGYKKIYIYYPFLMYKILPAVVGILFLELGGLLAGAIIVEQIYFFPGIGLQLYEALINDDRILLQVLVLITGSFFILFNQIGYWISKWQH